jgi:cell division septation protein DedD
MTDITHDRAPVADDAFHEIQLSGKQLVALFMMAAVVLVATFLCGVQVGRGVKIDRSLDTTTAEALTAATPPPAASTPSQPAASSGPPAAEPPAPAQDDDLSYAKRLQGDTAPAEKLKPSSPPRETKTSVETKAPAAKNAAAETKTPVETKSAPSSAAHRAVTPPSPAAVSKPGGWVVQLVALKDRGDAAAMAQRLSAKGYPAFVLDPAAGAPVIYRVQVGGYPDRDHADQAARRIEKEEKIPGYVRSR